MPRPSPFAEDAANDRGVVRPLPRQPRLEDVLEAMGDPHSRLRTLPDTYQLPFRLVLALRP